MRSKLTKTIFIIVFVVFLGLIKMENAEAYYAYCHYKADDSSSRAFVYITDGFEEAYGTYITSTNSYLALKVQNWASSGTTSTSYFAYDDAWKNDHCPQYLIYGTSGVGRNIRRVIYMSDATNVDMYKMTMSSYYKNIKVLSIDSNTFPNEKSEYGAYIPPRICDCDNGTSYKIAENGSLAAPKIGLYTPQNWSSVGKYSALDAIKNYECLDLVIGSGKLYLSDSAHHDEVLSNVSSGEVFKCKLNSQTPIKVDKPKPEYNPPTVNTDYVGTLNPSNGTYNCGNGYVTDIPSGIIRVIRIFYIILQIFVPIALVILGSIDLMKAITSQKDDEIKKGQQTFVKRLIAAAIIFFVFIIVKLVVGVFSNDDNEIISCMNCFLDGVDSCEENI